MAILSKSEYLSKVNTLFPDQTTQQISPADLREVFYDLGDSINSLLSGVDLYTNNFREEDTRTIVIGQGNLQKIFYVGRSTVDNIAIGYNVLKQNYNGSENVAIGSNSLDCNLYGQKNVSVGHYSLTSNLAGSGNVAIGNLALTDNNHGNYNIGIGYGAGYYVGQHDDYKLFIGAHPDAVSGCAVDYNDAPSPLIFGDLKNLRLGVGVKHLDEYGVFQTSGNITPSVSGAYDLGHSSRYWRNLYISDTVYANRILDVTNINNSIIFLEDEVSSINDDIYFSGGKIGIGTDSPSGDLGLITINGSVVPNLNGTYSIGHEDLLWDGYFNDILVSGRAVINDLEYNTKTECLYECTTLHLGSSGLCSDDWGDASKVCGYLSDAGIDGAGLIAHASGASYIRDYSILFRSNDQEIECLEEDSIYSRSHWESNVSIRTLPGLHVATDRILGDSKLSLVKQSGCHGIFLTTNSPDKILVGYERDLDQNYPYSSNVDISFLGNSGIDNNYTISFATPISGVDVSTRYTSRVSGDPQGFGFVYHDHKDELGYTGQPKDRFSLHVYDSGNMNPVQEAITVMRSSGEGYGLVGITNVSYPENSDTFIPETILHVHAISGADVRISTSGLNQSAIELIGNGEEKVSGVSLAYDADENKTFLTNINNNDTLIEIDHTNNDTTFKNEKVNVSGSLHIGPHGWNQSDTLVVSSDHATLSGVVSIKQGVTGPSTTNNYGKLFVLERNKPYQNQALYFIGDGGQTFNLTLNKYVGTDGLVFIDTYKNTFAGDTSPHTRPISFNAKNNTGFGYLAASGLTTGDNNTVIGAMAGSGLRYGEGNTFVGANTGGSISINSYNTLLGYNVGTSLSGDRNVIIGNSIPVNNLGKEYIDNAILIGQSLACDSGGVLKIGKNYGGDIPIISGKIIDDKRLYVNAEELVVEDGLLHVENNSLKLSHNDGAYNFTISNGDPSYYATYFTAHDNANNDAANALMSFRFADADGDTRSLFVLDHREDPMSNSESYQDFDRPYGYLKGDLRLRGGLRFADGTSLESAYGISSSGGTGIIYSVNEEVGSGQFDLDFTELFDVSQTGLLDRYESFLAIDIPSGIDSMVAKISIDTLGDYISSGLEMPSNAYENCNMIIANNKPTIQEQLNSGSIFMGCDVGTVATGWVNSIMIGTNAGSYANTPNANLETDISSIFIGSYAGYNADNLENALFIGTNAGKNSSFASDSVFIGENAGLNSNFSDSLGIGLNALRGTVGDIETGSKNIEITTGLDDNQRLLYDQDVSNKLHIQNVIAGDTSDRRLSIGDATLEPEAPLSVRKDDTFDSHRETPSGFIQTWVCDDDVIWGISCSGYGDLWHLKSGSGILSGIASLSGWSQSNINDLSYRIDASGSQVSGWARYYTEHKVDASGNAISGWTQGSLDDYGYNLDNVSYKVDASGAAISGWSQGTFNDHSYRIDASGSQISGWAQATFDDHSYRIDASGSQISGWSQSTFNDHSYRIDASGSQVSGWARYYTEYKVDASGSAISGWSQANFDDLSYRIDASGSQVSGWAKAYVDSQDHSASVVSTKVDASGAAISGWAQGTFNEHSYRIDASGSQVSGWARGYTEYKVDASGNAISGWVTGSNFGEGLMTQFYVSDGSTDNDPIDNDSVLYVSGVSGVNVNYNVSSNHFIVDGEDLIYKIDASGTTVSGWAQGTFTNLTNSFGIVHNNISTKVDASGLAISGWSQGTFDEHSYRIDASGSQISGWAEATFSQGVNFTTGSGLELTAGDVLQTKGTGNFETIRMWKPGKYLSSAYPSGMLYTSSGNVTDQYNTIINSGGYLQVPNTRADAVPDSDLVNNSGSIYFAGAYARIVEENGNVSPQPVIEGFVSGLQGTHGEATFSIDYPLSYSLPTSGYLLVRGNNFTYNGNNQVLINRDTSLAISGGDYVIATYINGEYRPTWVSCSGCGG